MKYYYIITSLFIVILACSVKSLVEIASQAVACHIPFEVVEHFYPPIPEQLQLRIAFWSFPENEEDIRSVVIFINFYPDYHFIVIIWSDSFIVFSSALF